MILCQSTFAFEIFFVFFFMGKASPLFAVVQEKLDRATAEWEKAMEKLEAVQEANAAIHED